MLGLLETPLGPSGVPLGPSWGPLESSWGVLGASLAPLGTFATSCIILGSSWEPLDLSWEPPGSLLRASWAPLGRLLGTKMEPQIASESHLGLRCSFFPPIFQFRGALGSLLGRLGSLLGASWKPLRRPWDPLGSPKPPKTSPKTSQNGAKIDEKSMLKNSSFSITIFKRFSIDFLYIFSCFFSTDLRYPEENAKLAKSCSRRGETLITQGAGMRKINKIMLK